MNNSKPDTEYFKEKILLLLEQLKQDEDAGDEGTRTVQLDQSRFGRLSRMDALQSQAMSVESRRRTRINIQRMNQALKRIEQDEYGVCVQCGEFINADRLEIDPAASMCIECAGG